MELYKAEHVSKQFEKSNFKLTIPTITLTEGSITGVVGENGNGKTTFLDIVAGESYASGKYEYFGKQITRNTNWTKLKSKIGFIPQRIPKWYGTLEQNLYLKGALEGIPAKQLDEELDNLLDFLGLQQYRKLKWTEISTGYRLRFELARVLLGTPQILVLDEPLANLDINTQQKFLTDLKLLLSKRPEPMAIILSSQQLHEIESVATQMLFLKQGEALFSGTMSQIADTDTQNVFELQLPDPDTERVKLLLQERGEEYKMSGPYILLTTSQDAATTLAWLLDQKLEIKYFRNLTQSTKRFFN